MPCTPACSERIMFSTVSLPQLRTVKPRSMACATRSRVSLSLIHILPEDFNFAYDVVDVLAQEEPQRRAMLWCDDKGHERTFTFADMARGSSQYAHFFRDLGVRKGDKVMLVLKRHYEFWFAILALHKLGAVVVPATNLLKTKDFVYRNNAAQIKMIVCTADGDVADQVDASRAQSPTLVHTVIARGTRPGWRSLEEAAGYQMCIRDRM